MDVDADDLIVMRNMLATRYCQIAASIALAWDFGITFGDEVKYFWRRGTPSIPTLLFFVNRYWTLALMTVNCIALFKSQMENSFCDQSARRFLEIGTVLEVFIVQLIHQVRIYAIYGNTRLAAAVFAFWLITVVGAIIAYTTTPWIYHNGCEYSNQGRYYWIVWIPIIIFELAACALATYKSVTYLRRPHMMPGSGITRVIRAILRDSILYFVSITIIYTVNCVLWRFAPGSLVYVIMGPSNALIAILGNRMLFNIRKKATKARDGKAWSGDNLVRPLETFRAGVIHITLNPHLRQETKESGGVWDGETTFESL